MTDPIFDEVQAMSEAELDGYLASAGMDRERFQAFSKRLDGDIARAKAAASIKLSAVHQGEGEE